MKNEILVFRSREIDNDRFSLVFRLEFLIVSEVLIRIESLLKLIF